MGWGARATRREKAGAWRGSESDRSLLGDGRTGGVGGAAAQVVFERWNAEISIRSNGASKLEFSERQTAGRSSFR
jgi:hypothetical protein